MTYKRHKAAAVFWMILGWTLVIGSSLGHRHYC